MRKYSVCRRVICAVLVMSILLTNAIVAFATPKKELSDVEINEEINEYLAGQDHIFEIKEQKVVYNIPLSNGEFARVSFEMKKRNSEMRPYADYEAKLGTWDFTTEQQVMRRGNIKVTTTVNITHVPDMSSSEDDLIQFTAYDGRVDVTPFQGVSVSGQSASTSAIEPNVWYETTGYAGFDLLGVASYNTYFTQTITFVSSTGPDRNKIRLFMEVGA